MQATDLAAAGGGSRVKQDMAEYFKGGIIIDVLSVEQACIAEDSGAVAIMAPDHIPADVRTLSVSRLSGPDVIEAIIAAVSIPVIARTGMQDAVETRTLQLSGVDNIDEPEILRLGFYTNHSDNSNLSRPFVCGATTLSEALRHINEGAAMIRAECRTDTSDLPNSTGNICQIWSEIAKLASLPKDKLYVAATELQAPYELVKEVAANGKLPALHFSAGRIATPADAAMMIRLGADGLFVGSEIFKFPNPGERAAALANAVTFSDEPAVIAKISRDAGFLGCD